MFHDHSIPDISRMLVTIDRRNGDDEMENVDINSKVADEFYLCQSVDLG